MLRDRNENALVHIQREYVMSLMIREILDDMYSNRGCIVTLSSVRIK